MVPEQTLMRLQYWREKSLLDGTPEALLRARNLDALLRRAMQRRRRETPAQGGAPEKLFLIMTRACQLRCGYCPMSKSGRHMPAGVMKRGIEVFLAGGRENFQLHFFGGEPLLRFAQMRHAVQIAENIVARSGKKVRYLVTTNGLILNDAMLDFFRRFNFTVVMSADGGEETFGLQRPGIHGGNFYDRVRLALLRLRDSGVSYYITVVVSPQSVLELEKNVLHLVSMGHKKIEITYAVGCEWPAEAAARLLKVLGVLADAARKTGGFEIINATELRWEPVVLKSEMALDVDGGFYRHIGIYLEELGMSKEDFFVARVDSLESMEDYAFTPFDDFVILSRAYARRNEGLRRVVVNNIELGWTLESFLRRKSLSRSLTGSSLAG